MHMYPEVGVCICTCNFYLTSLIFFNLVIKFWLFLEVFSYHVNSITLYETYFVSKLRTSTSIPRVYWLANAIFLPLHSVESGNLYLRPRTSSASRRLKLDCNSFKKMQMSHMKYQYLVYIQWAKDEQWLGNKWYFQ